MSEHPVSKPGRYWVSMSPTWDLVDTLWGGTRAMRDAGKLYLPQEPAEDEAAYFNRLGRSVLTPYYPDTLKKLVGKILKRPVVLEDDVPASVLRYVDDVDAQGTDINEWTRKVALAAYNHGVTFILVDYPNTERLQQERGQPLTREDELRGTVRPYAVHVLAPQILGWKSEVVNGQVVLTQVRILMRTEEDSAEDEFTQVEVKRVHVWEIGRVRIYREVTDEDGKTNWLLESDNTVTLDRIPIIPVYGQFVDFMKGEPPLLDVAHLNVTHWQSDSDQRNILHVARVPLLFGSGLGDQERGDFQIQVGPNTMTLGPQGSDMKFVEHSGAGIEAGANDLDEISQRIAKLGLNMVVRRASGDVTATARALDQSETDSPLGMFARHLESKLEEMLDWFGWYLGNGEDGGGHVTLHKDFSISMRDADDIKALAEMRARGDLSQLTYWEELRRRGLLHDEFDPEREIDLLDLEFMDSQAGMTEGELNQANRAGDETAAADGHTHILQANGFTNTVNGHRHQWEPTGAQTTEAAGHSHGLGGIDDAPPRAAPAAEEETTE